MVFSPIGEKVWEEGVILKYVHSNNEAEYQALIHGLTWCLNNSIERLNAFGDSMLLVRQIQGTWACKNDKLSTKMREAKALMRRFREAQVHHVPRDQNKEADHLAAMKMEEAMVGAVIVQRPLQQGKEDLEDVLHFLEQGEAPKHLTKGERQWLARKATRYRMVNDCLYCLGKDGVLRRVPSGCEIKQILEACHDGVCGGHFAHEITSRKVLQAGFTWPSLHRDAKHWCQTCKECQRPGPLWLI